MTVQTIAYLGVLCAICRFVPKETFHDHPNHPDETETSMQTEFLC